MKKAAFLLSLADIKDDDDIDSFFPKEPATKSLTEPPTVKADTKMTAAEFMQLYNQMNPTKPTEKSKEANNDAEVFI